jgi:hypothetical protein
MPGAACQLPVRASMRDAPEACRHAKQLLDARRARRARDALAGAPPRHESAPAPEVPLQLRAGPARTQRVPQPHRGACQTALPHAPMRS